MDKYCCKMEKYGAFWVAPCFLGVFRMFFKKKCDFIVYNTKKQGISNGTSMRFLIRKRLFIMYKYAYNKKNTE